MHHPFSPAILYFGTPVVLVTTLNPDGSSNLGPMSSAWWLGHRCMLGLDASSCTTANLLRTKECVLNLPSDSMAPAVNAIARTTGANRVPAWKSSVGYQHVSDKFARAGLTPLQSEMVKPCRVKECPVHMEARLMCVHEMMQEMPDRRGLLYAIEVKILRVHVEDELRMEGFENRIDPDKWRPLIMSFQQFYGLKDRNVESKLAEIEEENYRVLTRSDMEEQEVEGEEIEENTVTGEKNSIPFSGNPS